MVKILSVLLLGIGLFVFASAWQTEWNNVFGQYCSSGTCFHPEWFSLGVLIILASIYILVSKRMSLIVSNVLEKVASRVIQFVRYLFEQKLIIGGLVLIMSIFYYFGHGVYTTAELYPSGQCSSNKPILLSIRNMTFNEINTFSYGYYIYDQSNKIEKLVESGTDFFFDISIPPMGKKNLCFTTDYVDQLINSVDREVEQKNLEGNYVRLDTGAILDSVDRAREFKTTHRISVQDLN